MYAVLEKQSKELEGQIADLRRAKLLCEKMLHAEVINYDELQIEQFVPELEGYWEENRSVFKLDSVSFLYIWGSFFIWTAITAVCLVIGILFYAKLPSKLPVQWSDGEASSFVNKKFIFIYPAVCIAIRYLLRPCIYAKLWMNHPYDNIIAEYLTNFMCFITLSIEIFSILFIYGVVKNIVVLLFVNAAGFIGVLLVGLIKMDLKGKRCKQTPPEQCLQLFLLNFELNIPASSFHFAFAAGGGCGNVYFAAGRIGEESLFSQECAGNISARALNLKGVRIAARKLDVAANCFHSHAARSGNIGTINFAADCFHLLHLWRPQRRASNFTTSGLGGKAFWVCVFNMQITAYGFYR